MDSGSEFDGVRQEIHASFSKLEATLAEKDHKLQALGLEAEIQRTAAAERLEIIERLNLALNDVQRALSEKEAELAELRQLAEERLEVIRVLHENRGGA